MRRHPVWGFFNRVQFTAFVRLFVQPSGEMRSPWGRYLPVAMGDTAMSLNRHFWNDVEKFLDTASDRQLILVRQSVFDLLAEPADRATHRDIKAVYRLVLDDLRTRERLARKAESMPRQAVLA